MVSLEDALADSLNTVSVRLEQLVGWRGARVFVFALGAHGTIAANPAAVPGVCVNLWNAVQAGDPTEVEVRRTVALEQLSVASAPRPSVFARLRAGRITSSHGCSVTTR